MLKYLVTIIICSFLFSCSEQDKQQIEQSASAFDLDQAKASIKQSNISITKALKNKDTASIVQSFTDLAQLLPSRHTAIAGKDSIRAYIIQLLKTQVKELSIAPENVWGDSILLTELGSYKLKGTNKSRLDEGKYIALWKRESGNWKIFRLMWNTDLESGKIIFSDTTASNDKNILSKLFGQ